MNRPITWETLDGQPPGIQPPRAGESRAREKANDAMICWINAGWSLNRKGGGKSRTGVYTARKTLIYYLSQFIAHYSVLATDAKSFESSSFQDIYEPSGTPRSAFAGVPISRS